MKPGSYAIVGASESTRIGKVPEASQLGMAVDASLNALRDAGITAADIDGIAVSYLPPADLAMTLGIEPTWVDGTAVGGCSWLFHVRSAMAAIEAGLCTTVLVAYGEVGKQGYLGGFVDFGWPGSVGQQFDMPYGSAMPPVLISLPIRRYLQTYGLKEEHLAYPAVAQRKWAKMNPRAMRQTDLTVEDVMSSRPIATPIRKEMCCLVADAGGALIITKADRARDFPKKPVYIMGSGQSFGAGIISPAMVDDPIKPGFMEKSAKMAFQSAGMAPKDIDHVMIYDAFSFLPMFALEAMGFVGHGEAAHFIAEGKTEPGSELPVNTSGGGLSYAHSGSYGMLLMQEAIRQVRGEAAAQVEGVETSIAHGFGGFWSAAATLIFSNVRS